MVGSNTSIYTKLGESVSCSLDCFLRAIGPRDKQIVVFLANHWVSCKIGNLVLFQNRDIRAFNVFVFDKKNLAPNFERLQAAGAL